MDMTDAEKIALAGDITGLPPHDLVGAVAIIRMSGLFEGPGNEIEIDVSTLPNEVLWALQTFIHEPHWLRHVLSNTRQLALSGIRNLPANAWQPPARYSGVQH